MHFMAGEGGEGGGSTVAYSGSTASSRADASAPTSMLLQGSSFGGGAPHG